MKLKRVALTKKTRALLDYLQMECLPMDEPVDYPENSVWWIAYEDTQAVAFASIKQLAEDDTTWYLSRAGVIPSHRGKGIQKKLIRARMLHAKHHGAELVLTDCLRDNPASANSLISSGFRLYNPAYQWALPESLYWRKTP